LIGIKEPIFIISAKYKHNILMKYVSTLLLSALFCVNSYATSVTVSGNVSGSWTADTVIVEANLIVPQGETLVISPGTFIQFQSYYRVDVHGSIKAIGLPGDTIQFTIRDTSNFMAQTQGRGGWSGIRFRHAASTEDSSIFSYCRFEFSKATEDSANCYGGAILAHDFDKLSIVNCLFFNNYSYYSGGAVYLRNSDARIEKCVFRGNYSGNTGTIYGYGGGICSMNSSPVIVNNQFYENTSTGVGGAISFDNSDPAFDNNTMQHNFSGLGGAMGVLRSSPSRTMSNNLVINNGALFFGGGICCIRSFPFFSNFTVSGNDAAYAGGLYCNDSASPSMYNSIIWGNNGLGVSVYIWDVNSSPNFFYCNIEGDTAGFEGSGGQQGYHGQYLNNMNVNPDFIGSGLFPFQLLATSSCIDAGTPDAGFLNLPALDLAGAARITNSRIDMGVYEFNGTTSIYSKSAFTEGLNIFPNPFVQSLSISVPGISGKKAEISITDIEGRIIFQKKLVLNDFTVHWDGCNNEGNPVPKGAYLIKASTAGKSYFAKALK
jgi:hypothetical protein